MIEQLVLEVAELMKKAEDADAVPLEDGLSIPKEIARRVTDNPNDKKELVPFNIEIRSLRSAFAVTALLSRVMKI